MNHWKFDNNLIDSKGQAHMTNVQSGPLFATDRLNKDNSSLLINYIAYPTQSCFNLPNGVYVDTEYTLSVWVKLMEMNL
jgi:hypothetical protein